MTTVAKILVVDDEPAIRELIVAVLEDEGYDAISAGSGSRALELMPAERPDLVLMDIMMPEMDGREALRRMRDRPDLATIPVVMMSAAFTPNRIGQHVSGFLPKPFDLDHLLATVAQILDSRR
jgi:CheY-like chemotaxis protein